MKQIFEIRSCIEILTISKSTQLISIICYTVNKESQRIGYILGDLLPLGGKSGI